MGRSDQSSDPAISTGVTVLVPTIPTRAELLQRAVTSVLRQSVQPDAVIVVEDRRREGAAATRNRGLDQVHTEWVAFLDDDDELYPDHLRLLLRFARLSGADVIYPLYHCTGEDPVDVGDSGWHRTFDPVLIRQRNYIPVTVLARTSKVREVGGFQPHPDEHGDPCEDWGLWLALLDAGAKFAHLPVKTWLQHNAEDTTRGRPDRW